MLNWFKERSKEPTTYISLGLLAQSVMMLTKSNPQHTEVVSTAIEQVATPLASGDYTSSIAIILGSLMGVLMKENAGK